jgi:hypothetical protein
MLYNELYTETEESIMSELYEKIVSERGSLGRLVAKVPGFKGYLDKNARRTADRLLRDYIADLLSQRVNRLVSLEKKLLDKDGGLSYMSQTSSLKNKMQMFRDRVKAAAPGYSGFFEAVKVDADELEKLYIFDEMQVVYADQFEEGLNRLAAAIDSGIEINEAISELDARAAEAIEAFSKREHVITNLDQSLSR